MQSIGVEGWSDPWQGNPGPAVKDYQIFPPLHLILSYLFILHLIKLHLTSSLCLRNCLCNSLPHNIGRRRRPSVTMVNVFAPQIFFIVFRETLETSIVVSVLLSFVKQQLGKDVDRTVYKKLRNQVRRLLSHLFNYSLPPYYTLPLSKKTATNDLRHRYGTAPFPASPSALSSAVP